MREKGDENWKFPQCNFFIKNHINKKLTLFPMENRRGQFFLIAAVIIIVVIVSVITVSNYTSTKDEVKLYDLGQELGIESQQVIDSGTYSGLDNKQMSALMENFAKNYVSYIEEDKNIYFIFGNKQEVHFLGYQEVDPNERVCVILNPITDKNIPCSDPQIITQMQTTQNFPASSIGSGSSIDKVVVKVGILPDETDYQFRLKKGENFYFVIWREIQGERHVVTSD